MASVRFIIDLPFGTGDICWINVKTIWKNTQMSEILYCIHSFGDLVKCSKSSKRLIVSLTIWNNEKRKISCYWQQWRREWHLGCHSRTVLILWARLSSCTARCGWMRAWMNNNLGPSHLCFPTTSNSSIIDCCWMWKWKGNFWKRCTSSM